MENTVLINFRKDTLSINVESGGNYTLVNLPESEVKMLTDYFFLLKYANRDEKYGANRMKVTPYLIGALIMHIGGLLNQTIQQNK